MKSRSVRNFSSVCKKRLRLGRGHAYNPVHRRGGRQRGADAAVKNEIIVLVAHSSNGMGRGALRFRFSGRRGFFYIVDTVL